MMDIGFDTIGNAILICYDRGPILVTDPWLTEDTYFGSWAHSHEIPEEQRKAIADAEYVWLSHGHPDHLDPKSLGRLKKKKILLPNHVGSRIEQGLKDEGFNVQVMRDREWVQLSERIRVQCIADYNQDAILFVDVNGRLIFNRNDAVDHGWRRYAKKLIKQYDKTFLLSLSSRFGDADMINFFDENGKRIPPRENVPALGKRNALKAEEMGTKYFIPFSSMHVYQRTDSIWAADYRTTLSDYTEGFESATVQGTPPFIRFDCATDTYHEIKPKELPVVLRKPEDFGDSWDETLSPADVQLATEYFNKIYHVTTILDYINLRVGGKDNVIKIGSGSGRFNRGVTFEAPRKSLMSTIEWQVFDDMLIANFMKTTLHGDWDKLRLHVDFTPYVAKYGDNGLARSKEELEQYLAAYRRRAFIDFILHRVERRTESAYRRLISDESLVHKAAKRVYWYYRRA